MKIPFGLILDPAQQGVARDLLQLEAELMAWESRSFKDKFLSFLNWQHKAPIKGLYIYGSVGRGKTMLMDAFYDGLWLQRKERWHFHAFMQQAVHQRLKALSGVTKEQPIEMLAREIAHRAHVICFDEFHVTDIADAMILGRLFTLLFKQGVVMVATSNQKPDELYKNGLHRDRFLPFVEVLKQHCREVALDGPVDYRRAILHKHKRYFSPINAHAAHEIDVIYGELSDGRPEQAVHMLVNGREIVISRASNGVARVSFDDMCEETLGASDYLSLADHFHTILLEDVPVMNADMHNQARRFMTLIDILYDRDVNLVVSAAAKPDLLYQEGKNSELFARTTSRLIEMTGS